MEGIGEGTDQAVPVSTVCFRITAFIRVPHLSQPDTRIRSDMLSERMDNVIFRVVVCSGPVNDVIIPTFARKAYGSICNPGHIVRMRIPVHVMFHVIVSPGTVFVPEYLK